MTILGDKARAAEARLMAQCAAADASGMAHCANEIRALCPWMLPHEAARWARAFVAGVER